MAIVVVSVLVLAVILSFVVKDRGASLMSLGEIDGKLATYRKIRHILGSNMLMSYPLLIPSDLRMKLMKQLDVYDSITDDETERRWELMWMPKLLAVADHLQESDTVRQDSEFLATINGFKTNERLISDAKDRRNQLMSRPTVSVLGGSDIHDSHMMANQASTTASQRD